MSKTRRKANEPMKGPKWTPPFMVDGDERAQACSYGIPDENDPNPVMKIEVDSMSLSPRKAREFAKWLMREANYVEQYLKTEKYNRRLKERLEKRNAEVGNGSEEG